MTDNLPEVSKNLPDVKVEGNQIIPRDIKGLWWLAERFANSGMVPDIYKNDAEKIIIAWDMGSQLGLSRSASLQNIYVVNGIPTVWGDAALGIIEMQEDFEDIVEVFQGDEKLADGKWNPQFKATCTVSICGRSPITRSFSIKDAISAGLWENPKKPLYQKYPKRMLQMRARSWALRDAKPSALKGLHIAEEVMDYDDEDTFDMEQGKNGKFQIKETDTIQIESRLKNILKTENVPDGAVEIVIESAKSQDLSIEEILNSITNDPAAMASFAVDDENPERAPDNKEKRKPKDGMAIQMDLPEWARDGKNIAMLCKETLKSPEDVIEWIEAVAAKNEGDMGPGDVYEYIEKNPDRAISSLVNYYKKPDSDTGDTHSQEAIGDQGEDKKEDAKPTHTPKNEDVPKQESVQTDEEIIKEFNYMSPEKFKDYVLNNPGKIKSASSIVWEKLNGKWQRQIPHEDFPYSHLNLPRYLKKGTIPIKQKEKNHEPEQVEKSEDQPSENNEDPGEEEVLEQMADIASDIEKDRSGRWKIRLLHMRTEYPKEAENARVELGFGHMVMSEDAAEKWVKCILEKVRSKNKGKK